MDEIRFRRLEQHKVSGTNDKMLLSVPLPRTPSGKLYQYSPNPEAAFFPSSEAFIIYELQNC